MSEQQGPKPPDSATQAERKAFWARVNKARQFGMIIQSIPANASPEWFDGYRAAIRDWSGCFMGRDVVTVVEPIFDMVTALAEQGWDVTLTPRENVEDGGQHS